MKVVKYLAIVVSLFLLASCAEPLAPEKPFNILEEANPIPLVLTEGFALGAHMSEGLDISTQAESTLDTYTLGAKDLKGYPFLNLTVVAPRTIGTDIYKFAKTLSGQEWAGQGEDSPWSVTITGATDVRDVFLSSNVGLDLLRDFVKTIDAMGGPGTPRDLIAVESDYFVISDAQSRLWEIGATQPLSSEAAQDLRNTYDAIYETNNTPEVKKQAQDAWNAMRTQAVQQSGSLEVYAKPDGSFDVQMAAQSLETFDTLTVDKSYPKCYFFYCYTVYNGSIDLSRNATQNGYAQYPSDYYSAPTTVKFNTISCVLNYSKQYDKPLGCGPSAFIGLVTRKFRDGKTFSGKNNKNTTESAFKQWLVEGIGVNNRPRIANYMGTCWNGGGSMTLGSPFATGGNKFLQDAGSTLRVKSNVSHYIGNHIAAGAKANILKTQIGSNNNPVVAEYFKGPFKGHFSPVTAYKIYSGAVTSITVQTRDDRTWQSLTGIWGTERGLFYLE